MTGSEKQVKWAGEIKAEFERKFETLRGEYEKTAAYAVSAGKATEAVAQAGREKLESQIAKCLANDNAAWWIDHRSENSREILNH